MNSQAIIKIKSPQLSHIDYIKYFKINKERRVWLFKLLNISYKDNMKPKKMIMCLIPNNKCNLKCEYCYISQLPEWMKTGEKFTYDVQHIAKCLSPERLGGQCLINLTAEGETMLQKDIVELCRLLLEQGHYIELVTNLTITKVVDDFMNLPKNLLEQLEFKISFHYKELIKMKMINKFFENVKKIQDSPCSFTLELMPYDELIDDIEDIKNICDEEVGANCQVTIGRADYLPSRTILTNRSKEEYIKIWSEFKSSMFDLKMKLLDVKRKEFCYAGAWTLYVNIYTGEAAPCYAQPYRQNIFKNPDKPIKFIPVGCHCALPYCINGHAHISMGVIPEFEAPTYAEIRNRKRKDGTEWFSKKCKVFFGTKLYETNEEFSNIKKIFYNITWYFRAIIFTVSNPKKVFRKIRLFFNKIIRSIREKIIHKKEKNK